MKHLIWISLFIISCSRNNGDLQLNSPEGMSANQIKAREVVAEDLKHLSDEQYGISEQELALLKSEGLLTSEELNSLKIVR